MLGSARPVIGEGIFNASAGGPAKRVRGSGRRSNWFSCWPRRRRRAVQKDMVPGVADATADRGRASALGRAVQPAGRAAILFAATPVQKALLLLPLTDCQSKSPSMPKTHEFGLKIGTSRAADQATIDVETASASDRVVGIGPGARAEGATAVDADINAAPIVDGRVNRGSGTEQELAQRYRRRTHGPRRRSIL